MNPKQELINALPEDFKDSSKAWVYQSNRPFFAQEILEIREQLDQFITQWLSHGEPVKGWGDVLFGNTIIVLADEKETQVGGCSTDGMVRLIKSIERQCKVSLFDRTSLMFYVEEAYQRLPLSQVQYAIDKKYITPDTLYFDVSVSDLDALKNNYVIPVSQSWIASDVTF